MVRETNSIPTGSSHVQIQEKVPHQDAISYSEIPFMNGKVAFIVIHENLILNNF